MHEVAHRLAGEYGFPDAAEVEEHLEFAGELLRLPKPPSIKDRLRRLKQLRKANPGDDDLWAQEFELLSGREFVCFDSTDRDILVVENRKNRLSRDNLDHPLYAATYHLANLWERHRGRIPLYDGTGKVESYRPSSPGMHPSPGIQFISEALRAAGAFPRDCKPRSIRNRLTCRDLP